MAVSVAAVMRHCRNYFETGYMDGTFRITGNALSANVGGSHYVYISGSLMHDGVWEICNGYLTGRSVDGMENEEFVGRIWLLAPPVDFVELVKDMQQYEEKNPVSSAIRETFGGYSVERASVADGHPVTTERVFSAKLNPYRRMFTEVR
jgi:hypothetical protein